MLTGIYKTKLALEGTLQKKTNFKQNSVKFIEQHKMITSAVYCKPLKKVRTAIQNKCRSLLISGMITLALTVLRIHSIFWANSFVFDHPPCSLYLDPSDFHQFTLTKKWLGWRWWALKCRDPLATVPDNWVLCRKKFQICNMLW